MYLYRLYKEQYKMSIYALFCLVLDKLNQSNRADKLYQNLLKQLPSSIPPVRRAECYYLIAKRQVSIGEEEALYSIIQGEKVAKEQGINGWSLKLKALLAHSQFTSEEYSQSYQDLLQQMCEHMSPEQRTLIEDHLYP